MWAEKDSNLRTRERTDLQSVAFSHSAIYPLFIENLLSSSRGINHKSNYKFFDYQSHLPESNQRPTDYKSVALPAELKWLFVKELISRFANGIAKVDKLIWFYK